MIFSNAHGIRVFGYTALKAPLNIPIRIKQIRIWHENWDKKQRILANRTRPWFYPKRDYYLTNRTS